MSFLTDNSTQLSSFTVASNFSIQTALFTDCDSNLSLPSNLYVSGAIFGSGTGISNINYNGLLNKPDLSVYATNNNLNSFSTYAALFITNEHIYSLALYNNLYSISSAHQLSINNLQSTSTTILGYVNSISSSHQLSINNLQTTSTTILGYVNSISSAHQLSITNIQSTSTTIFNKTSFSGLYVTGGSVFQGASTHLSTLNISGDTTMNNAEKKSLRSLLLNIE